MSAHGFDRLRRRDAGVPGRPRAAGPDPLGRRALFSLPPSQPPALGAVSVSCGSCETTSLVTPLALARLALPSLHLPVLRSGHPTWMRCPSCGRRTWVRLGLRP